MTLKIIHNVAEGIYEPDTRSSHGGMDLDQRWRFMHLVGDPFIEEAAIELLHSLAIAHGWAIQTTELLTCQTEKDTGFCE